MATMRPAASAASRQFTGAVAGTSAAAACSYLWATSRSASFTHRRVASRSGQQPPCLTRGRCNTAPFIAFSAAWTAAEVFPAASNEESDIQFVLEQLRQSLGVNPEAMHGKQMVVMGKGRHLGIAISWRLRWRCDGSFLEEIKGRELGFKWGFDGGVDSSCWEMDSSGVARDLECDEHEALLMGSWVRTGSWLQPQLQSRFEIKLEQPRQPLQQAAPVPRKGSKTARMWAAKANTAPGSGLGNRGGIRSPAPAAPSSGSAAGEREGSGAQVSTSGSSVEGAGLGQGIMSRLLGSQRPQQQQQEQQQPITLSLRLHGGKLVNRIQVCPATWTVQHLEQPICGDTEMWALSEWKQWSGMRAQYPAQLKHFAVGGGLPHMYETETCQAVRPSPIDMFQLPSTPLLPLDTTYDTSISPQVPVWRANSGHFVISPVIDGITGSYWLLDTGASGFVICPKAAQKMGLEAFGELFAASIAGKVPARFIKASSWSLGPLTINKPVMMTMNLEGLVKGGPGEVLGIVGFDLFRRAVVELPQMDGAELACAPLPLAASRRTPGVLAASVLSETDIKPPPSSPKPSPRPGRLPSSPFQPRPPQYMSLYNPDSYSSTDREGGPGPGPDWVWYPVIMIASLPHVEVEFADASGALRRVLLMLDTGACGTDIMLHSRAIRELQLDLKFGSPGRSSVRGVGGGDSVQVDMIELPWLELAGVRCTQVKTMCAGVSGLDISLYSGGIVCGDLVARMAIAIDYSRKRIGFLRRQAEQLGA